MELNRNRWYVRLFFWSLGIWGAFLNDPYKYDPWNVEERGTNLCFFIRVMVVYMPLVLLLHAVFAVAAVASLTALPVYLFGGLTYGVLLAAIVAVIFTIWGVKMMLKRAARREHMQAEFAKQEKQDREKRRPATEAAGVPKGPGFFEVLWTYLVTAKKKVCPRVVFLVPKEVRQ